MEHANTDVVPASGEYRCTSCGDVQEYEEDDDFTVCDVCGVENAGWEAVGGDEEKEEDVASDGER